MKIALVALEPSADILAADFMSRLKKERPDVTWMGVGGEAMASQGLVSWYPMSELSVMGFWEVLPALPRLLRVRRALFDRFVAAQPHAMLGFDAPDFNLTLESRLRQAGLRTFHVVSPSVWAWRSGRVHKIKRAVDHLFALFPFELPIYQQHGISASLMGYPPLERLPTCSQEEARERLGLPRQSRCLTVLPGSRAQEIHQMGAIFLESARQFSKAMGSDWTIVLACRDEETAQWIREKDPHLSDGVIRLVIGKTHEAILASDLVLACSGTVTLETLLLNRPMVVAYKMPEFTWQIAKRWVKIRHIALPNLLAGFELVPERLQHDVRPDILSHTLQSLWQDDDKRARISAEFLRIKAVLSQGMDRWIPDFLKMTEG